MSRLAAWLTLALALPLVALAADLPGAVEGGKAGKPADLAGVKVPKGLEAVVVSQFPDVRNCSAMDVDSRGNLYVVEVGRLLAGVDDARRRRPWIHQDMALRSPQERFAMYERFADQWPMDYYTEHEDRVVQLRDPDGDGIYEKQTVFADGFNDTLDGIASGITTWEGRTYLSCIPNLWLLQDEDDDGVAEKREVMHTGFGVRVSIMGHDLNALVWGPDGMLYGSIGDRGYNVKTREGKQFVDPVGGCVFRMNPDGSDFEMFYTRLRNPKAFGFDVYGKLFAVDNDGNLGDQCTMTYLIEGGEKGWHGGHQVLGNFQGDVKLPVQAVPPWTTDRLWSPEHVMALTAAHLPSGGTYRGGPSGMRLYPGVGLGDEYENCFFVTNYLGALGKSGVLYLRMAPDKGGYKVETWKGFTNGIGASDCAFGYDGRLYVCDFGGGWGGLNENGRVVAFANPETPDGAAIANSAEIMKAGFRQRSPAELGQLLGHADMRVRQQAQYALARKPEAVKQFADAVASDQLLTRLHGVWGLGQVAKSADSTAAAEALAGLLTDAEWRVREQAAKALGNARYRQAGPAIAKLLADESLQVRCLAAIAIGKLAYKPAREAIYAMIRENNNECAYVRHSGMMALLGISSPEEILAHAESATQPERLVAMMCLRRLRDARIANFLRDADRFIQRDTMVAINDLNIEAAVPALAELLDDALAGNLPELRLTNWQRLINANYRTGRAADVDRLLRTVLSTAAPHQMRVMAATLLAKWNPGTNIDFSTGLSRPLPERGTEMVKAALSKERRQLSILDADLDGSPGEALAAHGVAPDTAALLAIVDNEQAADAARGRALRSLVELGDQATIAKLESYANGEQRALALAALTGMAKVNPEKAAAMLIDKVEAAATPLGFKQGLVRTMGEVRLGKTDDWLIKAMSKPASVAPEILLDVLEAPGVRSGWRKFRRAMGEYQKTLDKKDPLAAYRVTLAGGDVAAGFKVFHESGKSLCRQCHVVDGSVVTAGPDLAGIGAAKEPEYLLRALVEPSADLAPGYALTTLTMKDGSAKAGFFVGKDEATITIREGEKENTYPLAQVEKQTPPVSSMPPMGKTLSKGELRDLLAYLSSLK